MPTINELRAARLAQLTQTNGTVTIEPPVENKENKRVDCAVCFEPIAGPNRFLMQIRHQVKSRRWKQAKGPIGQLYLCSHCHSQVMLFIENGWQ
jgi:hypothetical protein